MDNPAPDREWRTRALSGTALAGAVLLIGGLGGWATLADIDGAVVAPGEPSRRLCGDLNQNEMFATKIERDATQRLTALSMDTRPPEEWMIGYIVGVQRFGIFVEADQIPGAQAMCHVSKIDGDWYELVRGGEIVGEHTGRSWRIGQRVEINFGMIDLRSGKLDAWVKRPREKRRFVERRRED